MTRRLLFSGGLPYHEHEPAIKSKPPLPPGKRRITNIWWDEDTQEIVVEHD